MIGTNPIFPINPIFLGHDFTECEEFQENVPHDSRDACVSVCCKMSVHLKMSVPSQHGAINQEESLVTSLTSPQF